MLYALINCEDHAAINFSLDFTKRDTIIKKIPQSKKKRAQSTSHVYSSVNIIKYILNAARL